MKFAQICSNGMFNGHNISSFCFNGLIMAITCCINGIKVMLFNDLFDGFSNFSVPFPIKNGH